MTGCTHKDNQSEASRPERDRTITCTQTNNYSQSRSQCPLGIYSHSFSSIHIYLAVNTLLPTTRPKSNDQTQMTLPPGTSPSHCCNPCSSQASRTLHSVTSPSPQLFVEGRDSNSASSLWWGHYLRQCSRFPFECKREGGGTEMMNEWGQARKKGKSRS